MLVNDDGYLTKDEAKSGNDIFGGLKRNYNSLLSASRENHEFWKVL